MSHHVCPSRSKAGLDEALGALCAPCLVVGLKVSGATHPMNPKPCKRAWSLGSDSWRHLTTRSIASRQPNGCGALLPLEPRPSTVTSRPARRSPTCPARAQRLSSVQQASPSFSLTPRATVTRYHLPRIVVPNKCSGWSVLQPSPGGGRPARALWRRALRSAAAARWPGSPGACRARHNAHHSSWPGCQLDMNCRSHGFVFGHGQPSLHSNEPAYLLYI